MITYEGNIIIVTVMDETMTDTHNPPLRLGVFEIISKSIRLFLANMPKLFLYAFIPLLVFGMFSLPFIDEQVFDPNAAVPDLSAIFTPALFILGIANVVVATLVYAFLVMLTYDISVGDDSTLSQYLSHGLKNVLPLVFLSIAFVILFYIGLLLLFLPGLYLMAVFIVFFQTVLIDGAGWKGLHASAALTKGYRWPVLGAILIAILISLVPFVILLLLTGAGGLSSVGSITSILISAALNAIMYGFNAAFGTQIYLRLSELKRGGNSGELTDVFR